MEQNAGLILQFLFSIIITVILIYFTNLGIMPGSINIVIVMNILVPNCKTAGIALIITRILPSKYYKLFKMIIANVYRADKDIV